MHVNLRVGDIDQVKLTVYEYIYRQINKALYDSCAPHRAGRT